MRLTRKQYGRYDITFKNKYRKVHGYYKSTSYRGYTDSGKAKDLILILPHKKDGNIEFRFCC